MDHHEENKGLRQVFCHRQACESAVNSLILRQMKKLFILLVLCCFTVFQGCEKEEIQNLTKLNFDEFTEYGELHNSVLRNVLDNFQAPENSDYLSIDEKYDFIANFNIEYVNSLEVSIDKISVNESIIKFDDLVNKETLYNNLYSNNLNRSSFDINHDEMLENGIIDEFEYGLISRLSELSLANEQNEMDVYVLNKEINNLVDAWKNNTFSEDKGYISGSILAISLASTELWIEELESGLNRSVVAPWVAADVGGAIYGAAAGAIGSKITTGKVNGKAVAAAAIGGAIGGSTGIAGKIGKFLFKVS